MREKSGKMRAQEGLFSRPSLFDGLSFSRFSLVFPRMLCIRFGGFFPQFGIVAQGSATSADPCTLCLIGPSPAFFRHRRRRGTAPPGQKHKGVKSGFCGVSKQLREPSFFNLPRSIRYCGSRDEPPIPASGGNRIGGEISRNEQSPLWGVATIEAADTQYPGGVWGKAPPFSLSNSAT